MYPFEIDKKVHGKVIQKIDFGHAKNVQKCNIPKRSWEKHFVTIVEFYGVMAEKEHSKLLRQFFYFIHENT